MRSNLSIKPAETAGQFLDRVAKEHGKQALSVRSFFVVSDKSMREDQTWWTEFCRETFSDGWLVNRARQRSDRSWNVYLVRQGYEGQGY